ncbi:MAG: hypothetical protein DRH12_03020 [Deltaproteobacteria bacterium]|nr:MAG: hypothetical protein DRH12_03020 [Deltaproteobacteria bacterium]
MVRKTDRGKAGVKPTDLNFMVVRGTGRVRRFKVSSRLLGFASLFFLAYLIVSLVIVNRYFTLRAKSSDWARQIHALTRQATSLKTQLYEAQQKIVLMKRAPESKPPKVAELSKEKPQQANAAETPPLAKVEPTEKPLPSRIQEVAQKPSEPKQLVEIRDLRIRVLPDSLTVAFKVSNASNQPGPVRGYVHIIWIEKSSDLSTAWSFPNVILVEGMPKDYKTGRLFSIRRFREVRASFERKPQKDLPRVLRIVAYDKGGKVVFSKDYDMAQFVKGRSAQPKPSAPLQEKSSPLQQNKPKGPARSTKALLSG